MPNSRVISRDSARMIEIAAKREAEIIIDRTMIYVLQRIPEHDNDFEEPTCGHLLCNDDIKARPGEYRLSFESRAKFDASDNLPFKPATKLAELSKMRRQDYQKSRGLGQSGEEWICLRCAEAIHARGDGSEGLVLSNFTVLPEHRHIPHHPERCRLSSAQSYGLNLWLALARYQKFVDDRENAGVLERLNGSRRPFVIFPKGLYSHNTAPALYDDLAVFEARGRASYGRIAEVPWQNIQYRNLSDAMVMVDEHAAMVEQLSSKALETPKAIILTCEGATPSLLFGDIDDTDVDNKGQNTIPGQETCEVIDLTGSDRDSSVRRMTKKTANISYDPMRLMPPGLGEPQTPSARTEGVDSGKNWRLVYTDNVESPEEKMARLPKYAWPPVPHPQSRKRSARTEGIHNGKRWRLTYTDNVESPEEKMARLPKYAWPPAPRPQSRKRKLDQMYIAAESADPNASINAPAGDMRLGRLLNSHYI